MASLDIPHLPRTLSVDGAGKTDTIHTRNDTESVTGTYEHVQEYIRHSIHDFDLLSGLLLHQKSETDTLIHGENTYSIVKCAFKDNTLKPKTVMDIKLAVNITDAELRSPIFHYQETVESLIKNLMSQHFTHLIDKEIGLLNGTHHDNAQETLTDNEIIFKKMEKILDFTDDDGENPESKRYSVVSKKLMDCIAQVRAEIDQETFDPLNIRENIKRIIDNENIRNRGFNTVVNLLTSILNASNMQYQYIENMKNARELLLREYDDTDNAQLPDERYQIRMRYYDNAQLNQERKVYEIMIRSFEAEMTHLWDVVQAQYDKSKGMTRITDFFDLAKLYEKYIQKKYKIPKGEPTYRDNEKVWDEISFVHPAETEVEKMNRTFIFEKDKLQKRLTLIDQQLKKIYKCQQPIERRVLEERLMFLKSEFDKFDAMINPFHVQPGLLLDIDITSIKHKKTTINSMVQVLNVFISKVSKGFKDKNFSLFDAQNAKLGTAYKQDISGEKDIFSHTEASSGLTKHITLMTDTAHLQAPHDDADSAIAGTATAEKAVSTTKRSRRKPVEIPKESAADTGANKKKRGRKPSIKTTEKL